MSSIPIRIRVETYQKSNSYAETYEHLCHKYDVLDNGMICVYYNRPEGSELTAVYAPGSWSMVRTIRRYDTEGSTTGTGNNQDNENGGNNDYSERDIFPSGIVPGTEDASVNKEAD